MKTNISKYQQDLEKLLNLGKQLETDINNKHLNREAIKGEPSPGIFFMSNYHSWYSEAHEVVKQLLPNRIDEFEKLYHGEDKTLAIVEPAYSIKHWMRGLYADVHTFDGSKVFDDIRIVVIRFFNQEKILESAKLRFESSLFDIKQILRADLFDSEIASSRELLKNGFLRAAGAVAGVVTEKHLKQICDNHLISIRVKDPTINTYNEALKSNGVIDVPDWRFIQHIGDLRNLCDHNKDRESASEEVEELINSVDKIMKTIF